MVLYLVRHAKAEASHPDGDRHRKLSSEGRSRIAAMLPSAARHEFVPDLALSSPYLRAVETRDLFTAGLGPVRRETSTVLAPDGDLNEAVVELKAWEAAGFSRIAVFTHNPFVTHLAGLLASTDGPREFSFHTPTILALEFDRGLQVGSGRVLWTLNP